VRVGEEISLPSARAGFAERLAGRLSYPGAKRSGLTALGLQPLTFEARAEGRPRRGAGRGIECRRNSLVARSDKKQLPESETGDL
jgi:hypothetical protein